MGSGDWVKYVKPEKELEAALAQMVMNKPVDRDGIGEVVDARSAQKECVGEPAAIPPPGGFSIRKALRWLCHSFRPPFAVPAIPTNAPATESPAQPTVDNELVMKCISNKIYIDSKFIISLFDFGGQSVFNVIHHFFLTTCGVYVLVFSMEWLVSNDPAVKETCLANLSFWLNSIIIHTQDENGRTAPVLMVGTRKDIVSGPAQHEDISSILYAEFKNSLAWSSVVVNQGRAAGYLNFFPVDNTAGRRDPVMSQIMTAVEYSIDASVYVHSEQPLSWLRAFDAINASNLPYLAYKDVVEVAESCDISAAMVPTFLRFLHEMGVLMWHEEDGLKDVVIMNPIDYFVMPAATVICNHIPTVRDPAHHFLEIHRKVKNHHLYARDWEIMLEEGRISKVLLEALLQGESPDQSSCITQLMIKFGLLVQVDQMREAEFDGAAQMHSSFVAPALLPSPLSPVSVNGEPDCWNLESSTTAFYYLFTASKNIFETQIAFTWQDCHQHGFLPSGFFERLICKAISWSQDTSLPSDAAQNLSSKLFKNEAILSFGSQRFRLVPIPRQNMIRVEVEGQCPLGVEGRLRDMIGKILNECMKSLEFRTVLKSHRASDLRRGDSNDARRVFIPLNRIRSAAKEKEGLILTVDQTAMHSEELNAVYGVWLTEFQVFDFYFLRPE